MSQKLKKLRLTRIDFVDRGANPGAHIALFKRATPAAAGEAVMADDNTAAVDEIQKRLDDAEREKADIAKRLEASEARMAKIEDDRAKEHAVRKAGEWGDLGAADDLGTLLYECRKQLKPETLAALEKSMGAWHAQITAGKLFAEAGVRKVNADDPNTRLEALAKAYAEKHETTYEQAYDAVSRSPEGRALYLEIRGGK